MAWALRSFLPGAAPSHSLRVVPSAQGPPPRLPGPVLPGWALGCPGAHCQVPQKRIGAAPELRNPAAAGSREGSAKVGQARQPPLPPIRSPRGKSPGPEHAPPSPPSLRPRATLQDLLLQSKRLASQTPLEAHADSRAPGCSLPQPPGPLGPRAAPTADTPGWVPTGSPETRASSAPWAQLLLRARGARPSLAHPLPHPTPSGRRALPGLTCVGAVAAASPSPGAAAAAAQGEEGSAGLLAQRPPGAWCCRAADPPRDINNII